MGLIKERSERILGFRERGFEGRGNGSGSLKAFVIYLIN